MKKLLALFFVAYLLGMSAGIAQPGRGGIPYSFRADDIPSLYEVRDLTKPELGSIKAEDALRDKNGFFYRAGVSVPVNANLENSGTWTDLPNGDRIWRLKLHATGALAIGVYYDKFWLPAGASLFLYNETKDKVIGAYTEANNTSGYFATELIPGESVTLEYYEPSRTRGYSVISISEIAYVYRGARLFAGGDPKDYGDSESCEVNINCPEGNDWQDEKKGVARIFLKVGTMYGWCSGSLINNVRLDCTPYFLTADHCGEGASAADLNQWVFYFNYEAPTCTYTGAEPSSNTITGCTLKANGGNGGNDGSDFFLVQFNAAPGFNPYFNGWDRNNTAASSGVGIHHPAGDIQKISTYTSALVSDSWGSAPNSHWSVVWAATTSGHGVTEGGSSGSPIFNSAARIVGDLTGGGSYCSTPNQPDMYGKFSYSWDQNGTTAATRLKDWLDPDNTGALTLDGFYCGSSPALNAAFTASTTSVPVGGTVDFTDLSTGSPTSWSWVFSGGTPGTSTAQNPAGIQYNTAGIYPVSLTISDGTNSDTETKNNYIIVGNPPPVADFVANVTYISIGGSVNFTDLTAGNPTSWSWTFNGGMPATSTLQNPSGIVYNNAGMYDVTLTASNINGSDIETKTNYIIVGGSIPGDNPCDTLQYPLPGNLVLYSVKYPTGVYGYISGNNGYSDKAKADYFTPVPPYTKLVGAYLRFGKASKLPSSTENIVFAAWDNSGASGSPGAVPITTDTVYLGNIVPDALGHQMTYVEFNPQINITAPFYLGVYLPSVPGDTLALLTNKNNQTVPGTAWEQWQNGNWYRYSDSISWGYNLSHAIFPVICRPDFAVEELKKEDYVNVYPNPASGSVTVDFGQNLYDHAEVRAFNIIGGLAGNYFYNGAPVNSFRIDMDNMPPGIYFLNIRAGNSVVTKKVSLIR